MRRVGNNAPQCFSLRIFAPEPDGKRHSAVCIKEGYPLSSWAPAAKDIKMKGSFKVYNAMPESLAADVVPDLTFTQHYGF